MNLYNSQWQFKFFLIFVQKILQKMSSRLLQPINRRLGWLSTGNSGFLDFWQKLSCLTFFMFENDSSLVLLVDMTLETDFDSFHLSSQKFVLIRGLICLWPQTFVCDSHNTTLAIWDLVKAYHESRKIFGTGSLQANFRFFPALLILLQLT